MISAVVPTLGRSPWLIPCLQALRRQEGAGPVEIVVVDQAPEPLALPPGLADRVLHPGRNLGFAAGTNLGLAAASGELLATVNDDAVVGPGWLAALAGALCAEPRAAAAQGINLLCSPVHPGPAGQPPGPDCDGEGDRAGEEAPGRGTASGEQAPVPRQAGTESEWNRLLDGCGLGWNRWWQAIQVGHGRTAPTAAARGSSPGSVGGGVGEAIEVFGVSATAALYRRAALEAVAAGGQVFDPLLVSYYEDAELAGRLRARGFVALCVPAAWVMHAGSASTQADPPVRAGAPATDLGSDRLADSQATMAAGSASTEAGSASPGFPSTQPVSPARAQGSGTDDGPPGTGRRGTAAAPTSRERWRLVYGNRYLAAARLLGRGLWPRLPAMLLRDLLDIAALARPGRRPDIAATQPGHRPDMAALARPGRQPEMSEPARQPGPVSPRRDRLAGIVTGWGWALRRLPAFVHLGAPRPAPAEVLRLSHDPFESG